MFLDFFLSLISFLAKGGLAIPNGKREKTAINWFTKELFLQFIYWNVPLDEKTRSHNDVRFAITTKATNSRKHNQHQWLLVILAPQKKAQIFFEVLVVVQIGNGRLFTGFSTQCFSWDSKRKACFQTLPVLLDEKVSGLWLIISNDHHGKVQYWKRNCCFLLCWENGLVFLSGRRNHSRREFKLRQRSYLVVTNSPDSIGANSWQNNCKWFTKTDTGLWKIRNNI